LMGYILITMDRQKAWAIIILIATFVTIPLDLILVPWAVKVFANGAMGGVFSYAITETGMAISAFLLLPRGTFNRDNLKVASKLLLAGLIMAAATWTVREAFIVIPLIVGAATYVVMVFILRAIPKEDMEFIHETFLTVLQRFRGRLIGPAISKG
jgi:hypothetical protein